MTAHTLDEIPPGDTGRIRTAAGETLSYNSTNRTIPESHRVGVKVEGGALRIVADLGDRR